MQLPHSRLLRPEKWKVPWTPTRRYLWQLYLFIIVKNRKRRRGFQHVNFKQTGPLVSWNAAQQTKGTNCQCPQKPGYIAEELFWVKKSTYKDYVLNYPNYRTFSKRKKEKRWTWRLDEWLQGWGGTGRKCVRLGQGVTRDLCGGGSLCTLTAPLSTSWLLYCTIVAHDMTILGNWVKSTRGCLSFLAIACESTIISEYKA